jgi:DNA (cytosine-5)-methyltransferase 1
LRLKKEIMNQGSLFSGIGGFDEASEAAGWTNSFYCEWNEFGQSVLKDQNPKAILYNDITKTDFTIWRGRIDVLTGGFPCQPYSTAGKRKGKEDERHLWPEMLRAIREIQPRWIVGENVLGIINWNGGMVFEEVQTDLEAEGYEVQTYVLPASGVNAPHQRYRVWFVAYSNHCNDTRRPEGDESKSGKERVQKRNAVRKFVKPSGLRGVASNAKRVRRYARLERESNDSRKRAICENKRNNWDKVRCIIRHGSGNGLASNAKRSSSKGKLFCRPWERELGRCDFSALTYAMRRRRPAQEHGQSEPGRTAKKSVPNYWENFPTQSPIRIGDDGFRTESLRQRIREDSMGLLSEKEIDEIISKATSRWVKETIKAGGNAVVPPLVLNIFNAINNYESLIK